MTTSKAEVVVFCEFSQRMSPKLRPSIPTVGALVFPSFPIELEPKQQDTATAVPIIIIV